MKVVIRRIYDAPAAKEHETYRVLVDRLWPRGVSKDDLQYEAWEKELAPTPELRKWFGHDPERWSEFVKRYRKELAGEEARERLALLLKAAGRRNITLLYGARDPEHNHALIMAKEIERLY